MKNIFNFMNNLKKAALGTTLIATGGFGVNAFFCQVPTNDNKDYIKFFS